MPVAKTESMIPGGFAQANELGEADKVTQVVGSTAHNYALISYLSSPLPVLPRLGASVKLGKASKDLIAQYGVTGALESTGQKRWNMYPEERDLVANAYFVFVDQDDPGLYDWTVSFYEMDELAPFFTTSPKATTEGIFLLDARDYDEVACGPDVARIRVRVSVVGVDDGPGGTGTQVLQLDQDVRKPDLALEQLLVRRRLGGSDQLAFAASTKVARLLGNDFAPFLRSIETDSGIHGAGSLARLVTAIIYLNLLRKQDIHMLDRSVGRLHNLPREIWRFHLSRDLQANPSANLFELAAKPIGVAQIRMELVTMFLSDSGQPPGLVPPIVAGDGEDLRLYTLTATREFWNSITANVSTQEAAIGIFNRLRFPKSALRMCAFYLDSLKNRHVEWQGLSWDDVIQDKEAVRTLVYEYENGPQTMPLKRSSDLADRAFGLAGSELVDVVLHGDLCKQLRNDEWSGEVYATNSKNLANTADEALKATALEAHYGDSRSESLSGGYVYNWVLRFLLELPAWEGAYAHYEFFQRSRYNADGTLAENEAGDVDSWYRFTRELNLRCGSIPPSEEDYSEAILQIGHWLTLLIDAARFSGRQTAVDIANEMELWRTGLGNLPFAYPDATAGPSVPITWTQVPYPIDVLRPHILNMLKSLIDTVPLRIYTLSFILDQPLSTGGTDVYLNQSTASVLDGANQAVLTDILTQIENTIDLAVPKLQMVVRGYADLSIRSGVTDPEDYNMQLSIRRANWFVARMSEALRSKLGRITVGGCGQRYSDPPAENPDFRQVRVILLPE